MATRTGIELLSALRRCGSTSAIRETPEIFFIEEDELNAFRFLRNHVMQYRAFPEPILFRRQTGITTLETNQPLEFYVNNARQRALYSALVQPFGDMREAMEASNPDAIVELARSMVQASAQLASKSTDFVTLDAALQNVARDYADAASTVGLRGITSGWNYVDQQTDGWQNDDLISVVGRIGVGKAQPLTELIRTPIGWIPMGNLKVGDELISVDGRPSFVNGIFLQGMKRVYRVHFKDGRYTDVCNDHLWEIHNPHWANERILTTRQVIHLIRKKRYSQNTSVRLIDGFFNEDQKSLSIDPWLLGVLIGDGGLTQSVTISSSDDFILRKIEQCIPAACKLVYRSGYDYSITAAGKGHRHCLKDNLAALGLMGCKSTEKRIPWVYMNASCLQRIELLKGLLDTDGSVEGFGSISISVSNKGLASDIVELVRSIGGIAKCRPRKTSRLNSYRITIRYRNPTALFSLPRKLGRLPVDYQYSDCLRAVIDRVEFVGEQECQCISVTHPSHLYVTRDYVVTHNTYFLLYMAYSAWRAGYSVLFNTNELGIVQLARRLFGIHTRINPNLIRRGRLSTVVGRTIIEQASSMLNGVPFNIIAGGFKKSVESVSAVAEATSPDLIVSDSAYLLTPMKKRRGGETRRETVSDTFEDLKRLGIDLNRPIIVSVQFNRQAERMRTRPGQGQNNANSDPTSHLSLAKIGETDVIGQTSSVVLGIAKAFSPHEHDRRWGRFLKGREGEQAVFQINYGFSPVNFDIISIGTSGERPDTSVML